MKIVFISNFFNHHQKPLSDELSSLVNYSFIETEPMNSTRVKMGWNMSDVPEYVIRSWYSDDLMLAAKKAIGDADVIIWGSAPYSLIKTALKDNKLVFLYSERLYRTGFKWYEQPPRAFKHWLRYGRFKNCYLLCASAYTAADYAKTFMFLKKAYKWGYFPEARRYNSVDNLIGLKHPASILWVARLIGLKHPEAPIAVAEQLKTAGYSFKLAMIGDGELYSQLNKQIEEKELTDCVTMLGAMSHEKVRTYMEQSEIFLFTSDFNEGWGAVLNEAMNSACAVVASHAIGSAPFLIESGKNGLLYKNGDLNDLCAKIQLLLNKPEYRASLGKNAYMTITNEWCAANAAKRLLSLSTKLLAGDKKAVLYDNGSCSAAERIKDDWFLREKEKF